MNSTLSLFAQFYAIYLACDDIIEANNAPAVIVLQ